MVSVGLGSSAQSAAARQLWFWTVAGQGDPSGEHAIRDPAVRRFRELGRHAQEVGLVLSLELYEDTYLGT